MKSKEIEEILKEMDLVVNHNKVPIYFTQNQVKTILSYIEQLEEFKKEHLIMKQILIEHGLYETLLNDDRFIKYLKEDDSDE